jgi:hypothetical protein
MVNFQDPKPEVENLITKIGVQLEELRRLDPYNSYLMDFQVDLDKLRITTGLNKLSAKYAPHDYVLIGKVDDLYINYTSIFDLLTDLESITKIYDYYISQNTSLVIHGFRKIVESIQESLLGKN